MEQRDRQGEERSRNIFPAIGNCSNRVVSYVSVCGAPALFSGIFLLFLGAILIMVGRIQSYEHYNIWFQLVGPILLALGTIFILACVSGLLVRCTFRKRLEEEQLGTDYLPQSFVFTGMNQPINYHRDTALQYIPPPYPSQDGVSMDTASPLTIHSHNNSSTADGTLCPPLYSSIYLRDNPTFVGDETSPTIFNSLPDPVLLPEQPVNTNHPTEPPPSYEEIFPENSLKSRSSDDKLEPS
ncbi:hypothetical protein GDO86_002305 [Hymenochirus boettgeri]|uniref:Uncharacterized protein n=1 Tax=Hymenochirus boettgeri TaxID=247094 RepID=A0A8T2KHX0_9PIPI|nr:hypothetical protein GDO86_002305 [Hymenochirus boettgeri]